MERTPHDGAQSQLPDEAPEASTTRPADAEPTAAARPTPAPQPVIAAPGKPAGEVDTRP